MTPDSDQRVTLPVLLAVVSISAGLIGLARYLDKPWLSYTNKPFQVLTKGPITPGTTVVLHVGRCNAAPIKKSYSTTRSLVEARTRRVVAVLPSTDVDIDPGCGVIDSQINVIPANDPAVKPGRYLFAGLGKSKGVIATFEAPWESQEFEVVAK